MAAVHQGITILLVEDDTHYQRALERLLVGSGYLVIAVATCADALRAFDADVAVLDIELPDGNGVSLAVELLQRFRVEQVLFMTGTVDAELRRRAAILGPVFDKTAGPEPLLAALARRVRRRRGR